MFVCNEQNEKSFVADYTNSNTKNAVHKTATYCIRKEKETKEERKEKKKVASNVHSAHNTYHISLSSLYLFHAFKNIFPFDFIIMLVSVFGMFGDGCFSHSYASI